MERQSLWSDEDVPNLSCQLCVNEKVDILCCLEAGEKGRVMNSRLKWDEACPHVTHFHRFKFCASTDEEITPEKVVDDDFGDGKNGGFFHFFKDKPNGIMTRFRTHSGR